MAIVDLLAEKFHITTTTVLKYLEEGNKLGVCLFDRVYYDQYRKELHYYNLSRSTGRHIKCVETGEIFNSYADIKRRKGLKKSQEILDHMGSVELGANLFRITQTEDKLRREGIKDKAAANRAHFEVGNAVRETIKSLGGTMPEDLPTPEKSIKQVEREQRKKLPKGTKTPKKD